MDLYRFSKMQVRLAEGERFIGRSASTGRNILVHELEIQGENAWAKGELVKADGEQGKQWRNELLRTNELPTAILAQVALHLLDVEPRDEELSTVERTN